MEKDNKIILAAVLILLVALFSKSFVDVLDLTGRATETISKQPTTLEKEKYLVLYLPFEKINEVPVKGYGTSRSTRDFSPYSKIAAIIDAEIKQGLFGNSFYFKQNSYVIVPKTYQDMDITGDKLTISAWVKMDKPKGLERRAFVIAENRPSSGFTNYGLGLIGLDIYFSVGGSAGGANYNTVKKYTDYGKWFYIAGVYDGKNIITYVNGNEVGRTAYHGNIPNTKKGDIYIGAYDPYGKKNSYLGSVDELKIYKNALSKEQIIEDYQKLLNQKQSNPALVALLKSQLVLTKTLSKTTVNTGDIVDVTLKLTNNGNYEIKGTISDANLDFLPILKDSKEQKPSLSNSINFEITIPAKNSIIKTYKFKVEEIPFPLINKETIIVLAIFTDKDKISILSYFLPIASQISIPPHQ